MTEIKEYLSGMPSKQKRHPIIMPICSVRRGIPSYSHFTSSEPASKIRERPARHLHNLSVHLDPHALEVGIVYLIGVNGKP